MLRGRLILDCSVLLPGPFVGKLLAERGARVVKVENPIQPDGAKTIGSLYKDLNELKEIRLLNLLDSKDTKSFHELVRNADGLIEAFRPSAKKKLGLDSQTLHSVNPRLSILSLVGYPEDGPDRDRAGHDLNFAAVTGCASLFREMPALPLADLFSAYNGAFALTAAMDSVSRGAAPGARVVVSLSETLRQAQSPLIRDFRDRGAAPRPGETLFSGRYPCYRLYTAGDGRRVAFGAIEPKFWQRACAVLRVPHAAPHGMADGAPGAEAAAAVQRALGARPWAEWAPLFAAADCCVEPVREYHEIYPRAQP